MTTDLRDLLELASDDVPEVDLATEAWDEARRQHRVVVRRTVLTVGAVAAAGAVVAAVTHEPGSDVPAPDEADALATPGEVGRLESVLVDGIPVFLAPDPENEARLPRYPDAGALAIPRHLGPGDAASRAVVGVDGVRGVPQRIRAVFLVVAEDGRRSPVVHVPQASPPHVLFPEVRVYEWPGTTSVLGPRSIADDRHRVALPQPGRLVVLDARDGSLTEIEVPDPTLASAGWSHDGMTVVARGRDAGWLVNPATGAVRKASGPVEPDWFDLADVGGSTGLRSFSGMGELTGSRPLPGQPVVPIGASVANLEGWVARSAYLPGAYQDQVLRTQGLVVVQGDQRPTPRVLAATTSVLVPKGAYRVLTWGPQDTLLMESRSERPGFQGTVRRVLAWDVIGARLWQVADVDPAGSGVGDFSGRFAL